MNATDGFHAVVAAAGTGSRMGGDRPKQYLPLAGATVLERALRPLLAHAGLRRLVVCLGEDDPYFPTLAAAADPRVVTTTGAATRAHSVLAGLRALRAGGLEDGPVLVHDAARPCLDAADLDALLATDWRTGALLATPLTDTLKRAQADSGAVAATVDRAGLWRALTPQWFGLAALAAALEQFADQATDESAAMELAGHAPRLVAGSPMNIKITRPGDLALAAAILAGRRE